MNHKQCKLVDQQLIRDLVLSICNGRQGIKGVDLCAEIVERFFDRRTAKNVITHPMILVAINSLVEAGLLVEVEYTLAEANYRVKSFYLPAGTIVSVRNKGERK